MPVYKPNEDLLKMVLEAVHKQKFHDPIEIIHVEKGLGLAESMNYGINKAKYDTIVTLHQDCIPASDDWLQKLIDPLQDPNTVASCSDVFDMELRKLYTPGLDEKGCAYKRGILISVGLFDDYHFLNSGEDADMYIKLSRIGNIAHPGCIVNHDHPGYLKAQGYKRLQNANTWGCLFRIYGFRMNDWWKPLIKANIFNFGYFYYFWRGFFKKKQDYKR